MILCRVDRRCNSVSSVQIKNFKKPCTRSNATIATSTNKNALISQSNGPLLSSIAPVFAGAIIGSITGCTFQIFPGDVRIVKTKK